MDVAVKVLHPDKIKSRSSLENFVKEITLLNTVLSQHLCGFYGVTWGQNSYPGIILEYISNGSLEGLIHGKVSHAEQTSWTDPFAKLASDICRGLIYLHDQGIVHSQWCVCSPDGICFQMHPSFPSPLLIGSQCIYMYYF